MQIVSGNKMKKLGLLFKSLFLTVLVSCNYSFDRPEDTKIIKDTTKSNVSNIYKDSYQIHIDSLKSLWTDTLKFFPQTSFAKVVGYTLNKGNLEEGGNSEGTIYDYEIKKYAKTKEGKTYILTKQQTDTLLAILNDTTTFTRGESGCFIPHHAFVFFDSTNFPIAKIDICFMCHKVIAYPQTPIMLDGGLLGKGWNRLRNFCMNVGMPMYDRMENH
jgi:hypothetical protein